jgi:serine/threonine protein kinase
VEIRRQVAVSLLLLSSDFFQKVQPLTALEEAVKQVRNAPHPGLRLVFGLEAHGNQVILVEELVIAPTLLEIVQARRFLSAAEVIVALERLAPVADHARSNRLDQVDFSLGGIQLFDPGQRDDGLERWIREPLTRWPGLAARVAPINLTFPTGPSSTWAGITTVINISPSLSQVEAGSVSQLTLLAYELLGGPRSMVEMQGRYVPLAVLTEEGNRVLRQGLVEEIGTASELVEALARTVSGRAPTAGARIVPVSPRSGPLGEGSEFAPETTKFSNSKAAKTEGDRYQNYEILRRDDGSLWELGRGAMGITYKAYDTSLRCPVALKVLNVIYLQNEAVRQRFLRDTEVAAGLRHQNVASVMDFGSHHGNYFYVTEFVDGQNVDEYVKQRGRLEPAETLDIVLGVARALTAVTAQQLVHGSLKPSNLILIEEEGERIVKVTDFGLSKSLKRAEEDFGSIDGFVGTPQYASPEQLEEREIDIRSDIYSLGATLYYLVSGRPPFSGLGSQIMSQHLYERVPIEPLRAFPPALVNLILAMMEKDPDKRPQNPDELRERILRCREDVVFVPETMFPIGQTVPLEQPTAPEKGRYQHFEILKRADGSLWELGRGGMGITYKACDINLRYTVALKVIDALYLQTETARQRFLSEAQAAAALRHPNVASVFHLGNDHGNYFYTMEFVDGQTVDDYVKRHGKLEPLTVIEIALQVTRALTAAARQQLVHRDIKPANLMVIYEDGEWIVKVIDFGLAKSVKREEVDCDALPPDRAFVGTPQFASPEQLEERDVDSRSDIYSLGATLYYLVTGGPPFSGTLAQIMGQHLYKPVPAEPLQGCPGPFVSLILSMMEKDRNRRPQNPAELRQRIQSCLHDLRRSSLGALEKVVSEAHEHEQQERSSAEPSKAPLSSSADTPPRKLHAFLCHSSQNKMLVRQLYRRLIDDNFDAWLDEEELIPGQTWDSEIQVAVRQSDVVIVCLSHSSITKEGYMQKEMRYALDVAEEKPAGTIYLIPARLDECDIPERLKHVQWVDLFEEQGYERLLKALRKRGEALGVSVPPAKLKDGTSSLRK